jgi:hypothetical protein
MGDISDKLDDVLDNTNIDSSNLFLAGMIGAMSGLLISPSHPVMDFGISPITLGLGWNYAFRKWDGHSKKEAKYVSTAMALGYCVGKLGRYVLP